MSVRLRICAVGFSMLLAYPTTPLWGQATGQASAEQQFRVAHLHAVGSCSGYLTLGDESFRFEGDKHAFSGLKSEVTRIGSRSDEHGVALAARISWDRRAEDFGLLDAEGKRTDANRLVAALRKWAQTK